MIRRRLVGALTFVTCLLAALAAQAAGTATVTTTDLGGGLRKVSIAWTCTAGGAVSANTFSVPRGELLQVKFIPGSGGTQPTTLYDVTLVDSDSLDYLAGVGADLSNAAASIAAPKLSSTFRPFLEGGAQTLDLIVANAGASKTGTVVMIIGR